MPADGNQGCYCVKRRLRYVADFWAALGQAIACQSFLYVGRGTKKINGRGKKLGAGPNGRPRNPVERQFNVFQN